MCAGSISRKKAAQERTNRQGESVQSQNLENPGQSGTCHLRHQAFSDRKGCFQEHEAQFFGFGHGHCLWLAQPSS